jgi:hypothetical protein
VSDDLFRLKTAELKKLNCIIVLLFTFCLSVLPQVNGVDLKKSKPLKNNSGTFKNYEDLLAYNGAYCITYPLAPIGLQHCLVKIKSLLPQNNLVFSKPHKDRSFLDPKVNPDLEDYVSLHASLQAQTSEINRTWELQDGWYISLNLTLNAYTIWFIPAGRKE